MGFTAQECDTLSELIAELFLGDDSTSAQAHFLQNLSPEVRELHAETVGVDADNAPLPSFIESDFTTKVEYEAWLSGRMLTRADAQAEREKC